MGVISEEQQAMLEEQVLDNTKKAYPKLCLGCRSEYQFSHRCQGSEENLCECRKYNCVRERGKRPINKL